MSDDEKEPEAVDAEPEEVQQDLGDVMHTEFKRDDSSKRETRETKDK